MRYNSREEVERIGRAGSCMRADLGDMVAFRYLSSFWLLVEERDEAFTPHGPDGFWEAWITKWMSEQFEEHTHFVDVGANVGYYSMMAAKAGLRVTAFEPIPWIASMISASAFLNRVHNSVEVITEALSNQRSVAWLNIPERHSGGASMVGGMDGERQVQVHTERFDRYFSAKDKLLIKIDAEGAEPLIWEGMQKSWKNGDHTVILEWETSRFGNKAEEFAKSLLDDYQNSCFYVDTQGNEVPLVHWKQFEMLEGLQMVVVRKRKD